MIRKIRNLFSIAKNSEKSAIGGRARMVRASLDAADTTTENSKWWAKAQLLAPNAELTEWRRRTIRKRARYEVKNNSYAAGIVQTLADYAIGTGPRLQMMTSNKRINSELEKEWNEWADEVDLSGKLQTLRMSRAVDGEGFAILQANPKIRGKSELDIRLIECDQVASPLVASSENEIDGVVLDEYGNVKKYHILKSHPYGSDSYLKVGLNVEGNYYPSENISHYFQPLRPGQLRGLSQLTPCLELFAQLRRYTLAVIANAEVAADIAGLIYTDTLPSYDGDQDVVAPNTVFEIERREWLTLPAGYKASQFKAEQPTTTYIQFRDAILNEIARALGMPFNIAAGNSSGYNYASGRLDHQTFFKAIKDEQKRIEKQILSKIMSAWVQDLSIAIPGLYQFKKNGWRIPCRWYWDGIRHVDPVKEASADKIRLESGTATYADIYAEQGLDWEVQIEQRAREELFRKEMEQKYSLGDVKNESKSEEEKAEDQAISPTESDADNASDQVLDRSSNN